MSDETELLDDERDLARRVARLERELAEARAGLAKRSSMGRAQLLALTDALPMLVSVLDRDHGHEFVNKAYASWFGLERRGAGRHARDMFGAAAYERLRPALDRAVAGELVTFETEVPHRDDGVRPVHATLAPRRSANGEVTGIIAMLVDLSDRFVDEAALRESEARFRELADNMSQFAWTANADGWIYWYNQRWYDFTGTTPEQMQSWGWRDVHHPDHADRAIETFGAAVRAGEPWEDVFPLRRRDGAYRWFLSRARPIRDERGRIVRWFGTNTDITEQRAAEEALRESEARYRALFDSIDAGFCIVEVKFDGDQAVDYRFLEVNPAFARQTGLVDAAGRWMRDLAPEHEQHWFDVYGHVARTGEPARFESRAEALGRWYDVHAYRIGAPEERRVAILFNDISARRAAEEALREETRVLETLNRTGAAVAAELDLDRVVQLVTDAGVELTGAAFGAFFYNVLNEAGESFMLYALAGADRSAFENFEMPRATAVFQPTFRGEGIVRSDDILADPRYGRNAPHRGMPQGHLPVRSYLAVPVTSRSGEVIGGLFFGHPEPDRFSERHERLMTGLAAQAAVAIDNARLYQSSQCEVEERRRAEAAVRESEARFRLIADSAPVPMWVSRLDRKREFVNRAYLDFLGITEEEAVDFNWARAIHPDDIDRVLSERAEKEAARQPFAIEARYRSAQGEWRWMRSESQPRWGANGEHVGFIGVAYDVTIAKEAERALTAEVAERTAERDRMWRLSQDLLLIVTPEGIVRAINPAVERYGYTPEGLVGQRFARFMHRDDLALTADSIRRAASEPVTGFETRLHDASGNWHWVSWSATPGEGVIFAFGRDVTADKARQAELEIAQEALRQSQKMEAVGQLTGGVAHDFNNLLTPIMGSLDMLRRRLPADDVRAQRTVDTALQATERAATLVQRLLAFARRQDLQARAVDVAELLGSMDELLARSLGAGIRVTINVPAGLPAARVDPNQLELAILNLSINARDAMPGGGTLAIAAHEASVATPETDLKPGRYVRIAVADTGIGMDADTVRRAVEPFFSTKGVGKGTGLGLSMVYGFAAQLGGALRLSSAPGVGTTAELWLPVSDEPAAASAGPRRAPQPALRTSNILLADDEDLVRMGAADMLTDLGYNVVEARSGDEALALLTGREADFDLLVTDYLMPDMNGAELAEAARRARPRLPVLLVTGYTNLAEDAGADLPRLTKPFRQDDLAAQVAALLKAQDV